MARNSALSSTRRTGSIACVLARPTRIAAGLAELILGGVDGLLIGFDGLLLGVDIGGFLVDVVAAILLLHRLNGIAVILHIQHAEFALHHSEVLLVRFQFVIQFVGALAPPLLPAAPALRSSIGVSNGPRPRIAGSAHERNAPRGG